MSEFPPELLHEILVRLPPDDLIRCLSVSKPWNSFIRQHSFVKSHLRRSLQNDSDRIMVFHYVPLRLRSIKGFFCTLPFEDDGDTLPTTDPVKIEQPLKSTGDSYTISIGNSVDGLVFLLDNPRKLFGLWNPSIQKLKTIPFPTTTIELQKSRRCYPLRCYGFGYDSVTDDYKLAYIAFTAECLVTNVYSLKHNSWKTMIQNNTPHCCHDVLSLGFEEEASLLGGALCWIVRKPSDDRRHKHKYVILTFDLATEEYVEFRTPLDEYQCPGPALVVLGGLLSIHVSDHAGVQGPKQDVWIMKEYGVAESWTLLFSMAEPFIIKLLAFSKNRERVLLTRKEPSLPDTKGFYWYDLGEKKMSHLGFNPGLKECLYTPTVCVRSLCLLDGDPVRASPSRKRRRGRRRS